MISEIEISAAFEKAKKRAIAAASTGARQIDATISLSPDIVGDSAKISVSTDDETPSLDALKRCAASAPADVIAFIDRRFKGEEHDLMIMRYVLGRKWSYIARKLRMSERSVYETHRRIVKKMEGGQ